MIRRKSVTGLAALAVVATSLVQFAGSQGAHASGNTTYTAGPVNLDTVENGPWTLSQGDPAFGLPYNKSLPTYTPGGAPTQTGGYPNLAVYPAATAPPGPPYATGQAGTPGPVDAYCTSGGALPETGIQAAEPANTTLPMSPYYFPFVMQTPGDPTQGHLTGFFDYRPKDTEEQVVVATSTNGGQSWNYQGTALAENPTSYCPTGDTNDNGQGHSFVMTVGGKSNLYTVNRPAGDNLGVGLLVHSLNLAAANPVSGLPAVESVGTDPDTFAADAVAVPATGGAGVPIPVTTLGSGAEQVGAGQFIDLNAASPSGSVIACTGTGSNSLTGCTTANAGGLSISGPPAGDTDGDPLVQVLADATNTVTIPQGPNNAAETGGVTLDLSAALGAIANANVPGRFSIDGATIYCVAINGANTALENCTTTQSGGVSVSAGNAVTTDPIVPSDTQISTTGQLVGTGQTNGLIAPDGIVGSLPASSNATLATALSTAQGTTVTIPSNATVIMYGEKILSYYIEGTVTSGITLPASSITIAPSTATPEPLSSGANTIYLGVSGGSIQTVNCTNYSAGIFSGCSGGSGAVASGNDVGGPGAATAAPAVLAAIGEGSTKPKTLFKNNEDLTVLRYAYTTDGINFTDIGALSGTASQSSSNITGAYSDIDNPSAQNYPSTINLAQGATDNPELRYVGTRGTIVVNPDGSLGMFDSGAWESDGDSDAFDQVFYSSSTDGVHWTEPTVVESTDYTFSARQQQDAALASGSDQPLNISAYFAGRAYSPTVVQNPDGTLILVFSGYSTPKPIPVDGTVLGDGQGGAPTWTVGADDAALYRNILTATLTPSGSPGTGTPEAPVSILIPLAGIFTIGLGVTYATRRRRRRGAAA
jgi:hypothetical protein